MCGISTLYRYTQISDTDIRKLHQMNDEMHYRGPDDRGVWNDETCCMAQVRLSIIGLERGKQPLFNEDKSLVLSCNGEIYNYIEIKKELTEKGHIFNSDSDSETILHLYEEYGVECLKYLRGMFAFCLWDTRKKQLFAARDRIGEKPLYYSEIPCGVVFSSELKAIVKSFIDEPQIDLERLAEPIRYTSPIHSRETYINQVKRVEPGQYVLVSRQGVLKHHYWQRDLTPAFSGSFEEAKAETLRRMRESVDICLRSDVPIAIMLSGGIDSSAIAAFAKETGREVHTITAGYKGQHACDERDIAKQFASEKGFIYHEIELDENDFGDCFDEYTARMDEPVTDIAAFAQWALYKKVQSLGFKVLLGVWEAMNFFTVTVTGMTWPNRCISRKSTKAFFPGKESQRKKNFCDSWLKTGNTFSMGDIPTRSTTVPSDTGCTMIIANSPTMLISLIRKNNSDLKMST